MRLHQIHLKPGWSRRGPAIGSVQNSYDNALAETNNGLYKAEAIDLRGPWKGFEAVRCATSEW